MSCILPNLCSPLTDPQHAKRKRMIADRYANTNVVREPSLNGISERAARFVRRCSESKDGVVDLFVGVPSRSLRPDTDSLLDL
jgi:hypothetical protein